jgi:NhaP-type Na+/H+ or K+/H+ antiporter
VNFPAWSALIGALLVTMVLTGTFLGRMPLTSAMLYLVLGWLLGPAVADVLRPDPVQHTRWLETLAEGGVLISLFAVGLQLGVPLRDVRWRLPLRLAFVSMAVMVACVAAVGVYGLGLPLGAAIVLGAILAPTDPVLASSLPAEAGRHPERVGFALAAEGGLNDGAAFPFVMLGLGLLGLHELGAGGWRWWSVDLLWATLGGFAIGGVLGAGAGRLVIYLRSRHGEAMGLDEFLGLGLIGLSFGLALLLQASGFLAVLAAGLALQRVRESRPAETPRLRHSVQAFNDQLERVAELALVLVVGAMLSYAPWHPAVLWFVPLLLLVLRPLSAAAAFPGEGLHSSQKMLIGWFGIRGIGSLFYLLFALRHGVPEPAAGLLTSLTLWSIAGSIVVHGLSGQPLMQRHLAERRARRQQRATAPR